MAVAVSAAFFFLVWGILQDGGEEAPWIAAGISASVLLLVAAVLRELILRRARNLSIRQERMRDVVSTGVRTDSRDGNKLTLERNAAILTEIKMKSDAANVLNRFSAAHLEVAELCGEYISRNETELSTVNPGSPRLSALLRGRTAVAEFHKFHLLRWAEIESRQFTSEAQTRADTIEKIDSAQNALQVLDSALEHYPEESSLLQSREVVQELVESIKLGDWVERAERAVFERDYARAKGLYNDALFYLGREDMKNPRREKAVRKIISDIEKIRLMEAKSDHEAGNS
ncbi:MAG: hypothetical protein ABR530_03520 [Pyrinomonadaceae bacterium]